MADVTPDAARLLADKIDNQPLSFDWSRLGITLEDVGVIRDALRSLAKQVERLEAQLDNEPPELRKHRAQQISEALGIVDQSTTKQVEAIDRLEADKRELWGALDSATELLCMAEHAWEREDYVEQGRINEICNRFGAAMKGGEDE